MQKRTMWKKENIVLVVLKGSERNYLFPLFLSAINVFEHINFHCIKDFLTEP